MCRITVLHPCLSVSIRGYKIQFLQEWLPLRERLLSHSANRLAISHQLGRSREFWGEYRRRLDCARCESDPPMC